MCLLCVFLPGSQPDPDALARAAKRNPDGFGWAIVVGDEIISHRTMDPDEGVSSFVAARREHSDGPALWHARFTTHGTSDLYNVHPFPVNDDPRIVVAHNGVLPVYPSGARSDTHEFAARMLRAEDLDSPGAMYWLGEWAAGSKLAILSVSPDTRERLYIVNENDGKWSDETPGVWYSNESHAPVVPFRFSADPRATKTTKKGDKKKGEPVALAWGEIPENDDDLPDPWKMYVGGPMIECGSCGELWPDYVGWCESCGDDISDEPPIVWDDDPVSVGGGS